MQDRFNCPKIQKFSWRLAPIQPPMDLAVVAALSSSGLGASTHSETWMWDRLKRPEIQKKQGL